MHKVRHILKQVPAIALLLLFVSGWLAVPLTLAAPEPIMCGMVCCEESGECCCFLSRQAHQHEDGDTDDDAQLVSMGKGCQSNCATPPSVSPLTLAQKNIHHTVRLALLAPGKQSLHQTTTPVSFELGRKSSPRAPPLFS